MGVLGRAMTTAHAIEIGRSAGGCGCASAARSSPTPPMRCCSRKGSLPPVFYVPRGDVHMERLAPSATTSHCPFKGDASYFSVPGGPADVAWSYETPLPAAAAIAGHLAFYPDKAEIETVPFG